MTIARTVLVLLLVRVSLRRYSSAFIEQLQALEIDQSLQRERWACCTEKLLFGRSALALLRNYPQHLGSSTTAAPATAAAGADIGSPVLSPLSSDGPATAAAAAVVDDEQLRPALSRISDSYSIADASSSRMVSRDLALSSVIRKGDLMSAMSAPYGSASMGSSTHYPALTPPQVPATSRLTSADAAADGYNYAAAAAAGESTINAKSVRMALGDADPAAGVQLTSSPAPAAPASASASPLPRHPAPAAAAASAPLNVRTIVLPKLPEKLLELASTGTRNGAAAADAAQRLGRFFWNESACAPTVAAAAVAAAEAGAAMSSTGGCSSASAALGAFEELHLLGLPPLALAAYATASGLNSKLMQIHETVASYVAMRSSLSDRSFGHFLHSDAAAGGSADGLSELLLARQQWLQELLIAYGRFIAEQRYSLDVQQEALSIFLRNTKLIAPSSRVRLPLLLTKLQPLQLRGQQRPRRLHSADAPALRSIERGRERMLNRLMRRLQSIAGSDAAAVAAEGNASVAASTAATASAAEAKASSLYYDPFAAMRRKQKEMSDMKQQPAAAVLWSAGVEGFVRVALDNVLALPLLVERMELVLQGTASCRTFARPAHVPPHARGFTVELTVLPVTRGTVEIKGVQLVISNAVHFVLAESILYSTPIAICNCC